MSKFKLGQIVVCHKEKYSEEYGKEFEVLDMKKYKEKIIPNTIMINTCGKKQWVSEDAFMSKEEWEEYLKYLEQYNYKTIKQY